MMMMAASSGMRKCSRKYMTLARAGSERNTASFAFAGMLGRYGEHVHRFDAVRSVSFSSSFIAAMGSPQFTKTMWFT